MFEILCVVAFLAFAVNCGLADAVVRDTLSFVCRFAVHCGMAGVAVRDAFCCGFCLPLL